METFVKTSTRSFADFANASPTELAQAIATLRIHGPLSGDDYESVAATLPEAFSSTADELELDRYEVRMGDRCTHEMWVYFGEHGVLFERGDSFPTPIHCVQRHFWSTDPNDADAVALAERLNRFALF